MNSKNIIIISLLLINLCLYSQVSENLNQTDNKGMKQRHWIKKYPNGHIQYEGYFKDNHPVGAFRRFYENDTLQSNLVFSDDGIEALATTYHPNGFVASMGKFVAQSKEGKWKFYSAKVKGYLVSEEEYKKNIRNGVSLKYYSNSTVAEKVLYVNDLRDGEWTQYFPDGNICLKANYTAGKLQGSFIVYFDNGKPEYIGQYKDDIRNGNWQVFNSNGSLKYNIEYVDGVAAKSEKFVKESDYLDSLEKNKGKIADPEKTGTIW
jgi:antitoxin component YwqK of YwqJK toxin-antitoxin module